MKRQSDVLPKLLWAVALLAVFLALVPFAAEVKTAVRMYRQDYDDDLPPFRNTIEGLTPYLRNLRHRPASSYTRPAP
jgi:hypothetical protein